MPLPAKAIPVQPLAGIWRIDTPQNIPPGASPDMQNWSVQSGVLVKRPGYVQYPPGGAPMNGRINGLYSTHDADDVTRLYAWTKTDVYKYNVGSSTWDKMTGGPLTGADGQLFAYETSQNALVFSQGVDNVQVSPFGSMTYGPLSPDAKPAKYVTRFADRLYLGFTNEAGVSKPFRIRWPVASDHTNWTGTGSGFRDNTEEPYFIRNIKKLQNALAVYTERSILVGERTGTASAPARYDIVAGGVGLYCPFTLKGRNEFHLFLGNDDFYEFQGGAATPVGTQIRDAVFQSLNPGQLNVNFGEILSDTTEYLAFLVLGGTAVTPNNVWVYNYLRKIWYKWMFTGVTATGPSCSTLHRLDNNLTIDQLVGTIDEQNWFFDTAVLTTAYPVLLTGHVDGKVYKWSPVYTSDDGKPINCYWTSKDWTCEDVAPGFPQHMIRLNKLGISFVDPGAVVHLEMMYSVDGGETWSAPEIVTYGGGARNSTGDVTWHKVITAARIRIKLRNNTTNEIPQIATFVFDLAVDSQLIP